MTGAHSASTTNSPIDRAIAHALTELTAAAPDLVDEFREGLPKAADTVARRVVSAAYREGLTDVSPTGDRLRLANGGSNAETVAVTTHVFDRIEVHDEVHTDPASLLAQLCPDQH